MLGELAANPPQRLHQCGRRRRAGKLGPKLLGRKADFQRFAVQAEQFAAELLHGGPAAIDVFGPASDDPALLLNLGHVPPALGLEELAPRMFLAVGVTPSGRRLLLQLLHLGPLLLQSAFGLFELLLFGLQLLGGPAAATPRGQLAPRRVRRPAAAIPRSAR